MLTVPLDQRRCSNIFFPAQDTITALEALGEYSLNRPVGPEVNVVGEFSVRGKLDVVKLELGKGETRVETDLKVQSAIHAAFHRTIPHSSRLPAAFVPETFREQH